MSAMSFAAWATAPRILEHQHRDHGAGRVGRRPHVGAGVGEQADGLTALVEVLDVRQRDAVGAHREDLLDALTSVTSGPASASDGNAHQQRLAAGRALLAEALADRHHGVAVVAALEVQEHEVDERVLRQRLGRRPRCRPPGRGWDRAARGSRRARTRRRRSCRPPTGRASPGAPPARRASSGRCDASATATTSCHPAIASLITVASSCPRSILSKFAARHGWRRGRTLEWTVVRRLAVRPAVALTLVAVGRRWSRRRRRRRPSRSLSAQGRRSLHRRPR